MDVTDSLPAPTEATAKLGCTAVLFHALDGRYALMGIALIALNLVDAFCTLRHVNNGAQELNPLMAELLGGGGLRFVAVKHALVSLGVVGILLRADTRMARLALWTLIVIFGAIVVYHAILWHTFP